MGSQLEARGLSKTFGGVKALDRADFEVRSGSVAGLIGPNGSGKTTLLNAISGMISPDSGETELDGLLLPEGHPAEVAARGVARTFQHIRLLPKLTVRENVGIGGVHESLRRPFGTARLWVASRRARRELAERTERCLDIAGVPAALRERSPSVLSYGVQRRVEIARAICGNPTLLLLDEPAAGMNDQETDALGRMIVALSADSDMTVVLVDHNLELIFGYVDTLTAFDRGRRIARGTPDEVRQNPAVVESYLGAATDE